MALFSWIESFGTRSEHFITASPQGRFLMTEKECSGMRREFLGSVCLTLQDYQPWNKRQQTCSRSHLGRENQMWCGWTWAGNWWKNKKEDEDGENLTLVLFSRGLRLKLSLAQDSLRAFDPWRNLLFIFCCGAGAAVRDHLIMTHAGKISQSCVYFDYSKKQWDEKQKINSSDRLF